MGKVPRPQRPTNPPEPKPSTQEGNPTTPPSKPPGPK